MQARAIDDHLKSTALEYLILRADLVSEVHHIHKPGAAGRLHAHTQPLTMAALRHRASYMLGCRLSQCYRHDGLLQTKEARFDQKSSLSCKPRPDPVLCCRRGAPATRMLALRHFLHVLSRYEIGEADPLEKLVDAPTELLP